jgi:uncharacterized protein (TIGR02147 family)
MTTKRAKLDIRAILIRELDERCRKNPRYSIRAFAKFLDVDYSTLSKMINGRRPVGERLTRRLALRLGYGTTQALDVNLNSALKTAEYRPIPAEDLRLIPEWYHFAILELIKIQGVKHTPGHFARRLGINQWQVRAAIDQLVGAGMLKFDADAGWIDTSSGFTSSIGVPAADVARNLQIQLVKKSLDALEHIHIERRDHTSLTVALSRSRLNEAKELIKTFRRQMDALLSKDTDYQDVYVLNIGFFPVTKST